MKYLAILIGLMAINLGIKAQYVYTIKADSVKITNCDSSELIIENHTQGVHGFLYNYNNGRTVFKRGAIKLTDTSYIVGGDTVKWRNNAWVQGGNSFGTTGVLGTLDSNNLDLYTNNLLRARLTKAGNLVLGGTNDNFNLFQVNGPISINPNPHLPAGQRVDITFQTGGTYDGTIGFYGHDMIFQTISRNTGFQFRFGGDTTIVDTALAGTGSIKSFGFGSRPGQNVYVTPNAAYLDIYALQNVFTDASPITLSSGGQPGMDGVIITRNARDTLLGPNWKDPLLSVKEFDTVVMRVQRNGSLLLGTTLDSGFRFRSVGGDFSLNNGKGSSIVSNSYPELSVKSPFLDLVSSSLKLWTTDGTAQYLSASPTQTMFTNPTGSYQFGLTGGSSTFVIQATGDGSGITRFANSGTGLYPYVDFQSSVHFTSPAPAGGANFLFVANGGGGEAFAVQDSSHKDKIRVMGSTGNVIVGRYTNDYPDDGKGFQVKGSASFNDSIVLWNIPQGASTDSVLVWNAQSHTVRKYGPAPGWTINNGVLNSSLAVNGPLSAKSLRLQTDNWPDYVFDSAYQLLPLAQVRDYIQEHHHLPGVVPAEEAKKNGVDVGTTQAALLKKIEELTLYTISQQKEMEMMKEEINQLKAIIKTRN